MAIRKKQRASGDLSYLVYWINPYTGRQESKNFHDQKEAKAYDSLIKHKIKHDNETFKPKEYVRTGNELTVEDAAFLYLREKQFTPKLTAKFLSIIKMTLEKFGHIRLTDFDKHAFEEVKLYLKNKPYEKAGKQGNISQTYIHHQLSRLRSILTWSHQKDFIKQLPYMKVESPLYQKFIPPSIEEVQRLIEVAPPHIFRAIILGAYIGLRVGESELLALTWDKVNFENAYILIDTSKKNVKQQWRQIPIRDDLLPLFKQWHTEDAANNIRYIVNYKGEQVGSIKKAWATTCRNAGIDRKIRPYDLRHTFATQLIKEGVDVGTVANLMGHSSPQMVYKHYQHVLTEQKKNAVESYREPRYLRMGIGI